MSTAPILTVALLEESDIVLARQRARQIAGLLGFDRQDQTRIATAVSEIARNAATYGGGGRIEFALDTEDKPEFIIQVRDKGPGIADVGAILDGSFKSESGMGVGISGTRRLMDRFEIASSPGKGTEVILSKYLPGGPAATTLPALAEIGRALAATGAADPVAEVRTQNRELLRSLAEIEAKQEEAARLNTELEITNQGVLALYAELDAKAVQLAALNASLEKRVEAAVAECQQVNDTLRQSQKMEAVGQLTGGIAHDFNNLLQIITGNLEMVLRRSPPNAEKLLRAANTAMSGAERAAALTQRLLSFSRRQPLAPKPLDTNNMVESIFDLIRRTIGEKIAIETELAVDLWSIEADANQLENALLNLAVNARDAMDLGGTLTITTANTTIVAADTQEVAPGEYVSIRVGDTGAGMSEETMSRVFEPFFTTKDVGKGTGLGLSMVYGFAKQSGGYVAIESCVGRGTTVAICLPRFFGPVEAAAPPASVITEHARDCESILVVEDDTDVRTYTCEILQELGYTVHAAPDAASAIEMIESRLKIDLIFTDVVLTGSLTGRDVANRANAVRQGTSILFTTGYAREAIVHNERLDADVDLLAKPFTSSALAAKVRICLDRSKPVG